MNYMILHPDGYMAIVVNTIVYELTIAMEKFPVITEELIAAGNFMNDGVLVGDRYYVGEPEYSFIVKLYTDYPEDYLVSDVVDCAKQFGATLSKQEYCYCCMKSYTRDDAVKMKEWSAANRPGWVFDLKEEQSQVLESGENEVMATEEPDKVVMSDTQEVEEEPTQEVEEEPTQIIYPPIPEKAYFNPVEIAETELSVDIEEDSIVQNSGRYVKVPTECRGETWSQTWKHCRPEDVMDDAFCIEKNWEKRGDYYITDCMLTGNRLIHSDKLSINIAVPAKVCRQEEIGGEEA